MREFLMATDLSARSDRALERAVMLAREHDARLTIVHVVDEDLPAVLADSQKNAAEESIRQHVNALTGADGLDVSTEVIFGRAYIDILEMSEKMEAEMIILGVHREDALKDLFRGTTAERIIRGSNVPVLLVKDRPNNPYRRIMVGVDFSVYSRRAVEFAIGFAPSGEFHLVHAYDVPFKGFLYGRDTRKQVSKQHQMQLQKMIEEEMSAFLDTFKANGPKIERVMQEGSAREVIHGQVKRQKPDLLVVGTHGRTGVAHALLGSVAEDLLSQPPCDVLAVKAW
jgi:nucleotide-binding universal stress UspA family protein